MDGNDDLSLKRREGLQQPVYSQPVEHFFDSGGWDAGFETARQLEGEHVAASSVGAYFTYLSRRRSKAVNDLVFQRFPPKQRPELALGRGPTPFQITHSPRGSQESFAIAYVVHQLPDNEKPCISLERRGLHRIVTIDCFEQADCTDLFEVRSIETAAHESARRPPTEIPVFRNVTLALKEPAQRRCTVAKSHTQPLLITPAAAARTPHPLLIVIYHALRKCNTRQESLRHDDYFAT